MKIGITFDLKADVPARPDLPDDFQEEFDSPVTVEAIATVLRGLGHEVVLLGDGRELLERLLADPPDFVFNIAEGQSVGRSREARVPAVLEMLGIPHTGSDPLTLAVTLDKDCARKLAKAVGVTVPNGGLLPPGWTPECWSPDPALESFPVFVKPAWEGSSKGIRGNCLVERIEEFGPAVESLGLDYRQPVLVEEFIAGDELTVGIVGNEPARIVGIMRVLPVQATDRFVYSLEVKRDYQRLVRYECPANLPKQTLKAVSDAAYKVFHGLGCRDVARVDFRLRDGVPYFLEVNPLPGLNPESSDLVILAKRMGWSYERLITSIFQVAQARCAATAATTATT
jgi:D-alanine-D-alanine ligase